MELQKFRNLMPLNIQLFAEEPGADGGGEGDKGKDPKQPTNEEYQKLKASFDKTSSELAQLKKQLAAKMSDDEKKAAEEAEKVKKYEEIEKQNKELKLTSTLTTAGYSSDDIQKLIKPIIEGNADDLCKVLSDIRKTMTDEITKKAKEEFSKSSRIPGSTGNGNDEIDPDIQALIEQKKSKPKTNAREYYLGKN